MLDPSGPLPAVVYWRRRAVTLGAVVLAVVLLVWCGFSLFGSEPEQPPPEPPRPVAVHAPPPEPQPCADAAIRVMAEPAHQEFPIGERITLRIAVTNVGEHECRRATSEVLPELIVSDANGQRLWSSRDCDGQSTGEQLLLRPGEVTTTEVLWSGHTSRPGCPAERRAVTAGDYGLVAELGDLHSEPVPFRLTSGA